MPATTNITRKITDTILTTVPVEDQAVLLMYVNKGLDYNDAKDLLSDEALGLIYDHHVPTKEPTVTETKQETAVTTEPTVEERIAQYNSRKYKKADLAKLLVEAEDRAAQITKPEPTPEPVKETKWSEHEQGVFKFWRDIQWSKHLRPNQRVWATSVAKYVTMQQKGEKKWLVGWNTKFYSTNRQVLRKVMKTWLAAAQAAGVHAQMKPTGLLVTFR